MWQVENVSIIHDSYYKLLQKIIAKCGKYKIAIDITKYGIYYKMWQEVNKVCQLLHSAVVITQ